jgi:hypothetical protein
MGKGGGSRASGDLRCRHTPEYVGTLGRRGQYNKAMVCAARHASDLPPRKCLHDKVQGQGHDSGKSALHDGHQRS